MNRRRVPSNRRRRGSMSMAMPVIGSVRTRRIQARARCQLPGGEIRGDHSWCGRSGSRRREGPPAAWWPDAVGRWRCGGGRVGLEPAGDPSRPAGRLRVVGGWFAGGDGAGVFGGDGAVAVEVSGCVTAGEEGGDVHGEVDLDGYLVGLVLSGESLDGQVGHQLHQRPGVTGGSEGFGGGADGGVGGDALGDGDQGGVHGHGVGAGRHHTRRSFSAWARRCTNALGSAW